MFYFRRIFSTIGYFHYTTALIKRKSFASVCGEWLLGYTTFDQPLIVYKDYERIASALLASIRDIFPGRMRALPQPNAIDIKAIIMSESPLVSGHVTTLY
jgi:hypothetical protein